MVLPGIRNHLLIDREALRRLFGFGKYIFLATIAAFFVSQGDKAILGKFVSLSELAIYNIAFFLASVPMLLSRTVDQAVLFPLYARRPPSDSISNRRKINRARFLITGTMMAVLAVMALSGDWMVRLLYDARYYGAGPLMILIAVAAVPKVIAATYLSLPLAAGHSGRYAFLLVLNAVLDLGLMLFGVSNYGMLGVIAAPFLGALLFHPVLVFMIRRYRGGDAWHDLFYFALALAIGTAAFLLHRDLVLPLFEQALAGG